MSNSSQSGSPYTVPTGPGFVGTHRVSHWSVYISLGTRANFDWQHEDEILALDRDCEPGLALAKPEEVEETRDDAVAVVDVKNDGEGCFVRPPNSALRTIAGLEDGDDVRTYDRRIAVDDGRDENVLVVVASDDDPFLES